MLETLSSWSVSLFTPSFARSTQRQLCVWLHLLLAFYMYVYDSNELPTYLLRSKKIVLPSSRHAMPMPMPMPMPMHMSMLALPFPMITFYLLFLLILTAYRLVFSSWWMQQASKPLKSICSGHSYHLSFFCRASPGITRAIMMMGDPMLRLINRPSHSSH